MHTLAASATSKTALSLPQYPLQPHAIYPSSPASSSREVRFSDSRVQSAITPCSRLANPGEEASRLRCIGPASNAGAQKRASRSRPGTRLSLVSLVQRSCHSRAWRPRGQRSSRLWRSQAGPQRPCHIRTTKHDAWTGIVPCSVQLEPSGDRVRSAASRRLVLASSHALLMVPGWVLGRRAYCNIESCAWPAAPHARMCRTIPSRLEQRPRHCRYCLSARLPA